MATSLSKVRNEHIGRFFFKAGAFSLLQKSRLSALEKLFTETLIEDVLVPLITQTHHISLRVLDWLVTNFTQTHHVIYRLNETEVVNLRSEYKIWLRLYGKRLFDPFRRRNRVYFDLGSRTYETTPAQLNFVWFCHRYKVLEYATFNLKAIETDMNVCLIRAKKRKAQGQPQKRKKLCKRSVGVQAFSTTIIISST